MNKIKNSQQSVETGKAAYVKPTMQVYEMEVEEGLMVGNSNTGGDDFGNGGHYSQATPASRGTWGNIWENEETM